MPHTLIITAHPSPQGFTHKIAAAFAESRAANGWSVTTMDLYSREWALDFVRFTDMRELKSDLSHLSRHQEEVRRADEIVFVFPVWWYMEPAILKNFIDNVFTAGFAFHFERTGNIKGHLQPRTVRLISTAGGPGLLYHLGFLPYAPTLRKTLRNCGLSILSKTLFGSKRKPDPIREEKWLRKVRTLAEK